MGVDTRRATEGPGDVVDTTARSPTERPTPVQSALHGVPRRLGMRGTMQQIGPYPAPQ